ncbi:MAG TPA: hypothetical protein VL494_13815 [Steroidobacteraceae bacterium]|nr:hypothetical protein [Steroidobacteraceae bacterium]
MSLLLLDSQDAGPAVAIAVAVDVSGDVTASVTVVETMTMTIAVDITNDLSASAHTPFIVPEPGCVRVAIITH